MAKAKLVTVTMINSVGDHVAGTRVKLSPEEADNYIIKGYAEGELSGEWSDEQRAAIRGNHQEVSV